MLYGLVRRAFSKPANLTLPANMLLLQVRFSSHVFGLRELRDWLDSGFVANARLM